MHDRGPAADDAGASEVAFMLDENSYPTDSILGASALPPNLKLASCAFRLQGCHGCMHLHCHGCSSQLEACCFKGSKASR